MRYMIVVKATRDSEAGTMPTAEMFEKMGKYHEELAKAGVLIDASGLQASTKGWRIEYQGEQRSVVDGPFAETKELIAGYTIIKVKSEAEAREWTKRFPNPSFANGTGQIEVRRMFELDDFDPHPEVERFRNIPGNGRPAPGN
jgi:hypothetical protein